MSNDQPLQKGQQVQIKPEFLDPGEKAVPCYVVEDRGDRVLVMKDIGWKINPTENIAKRMLSL